MPGSGIFHTRYAMLMLVINLYKILWCVRGLYLKNIKYLQDFLSNQEETVGGWKKLHEEL